MEDLFAWLFNNFRAEWLTAFFGFVCAFLLAGVLDQLKTIGQMLVHSNEAQWRAAKENGERSARTYNKLCEIEEALRAGDPDDRRF